jgi:hypothetical protein
MSRAQQGQILNTATGQNTTQNANSNTSYNTAQQDVGQYESELGKFDASNPYQQGGEYQTSQNAALSDTAAGADQQAAQTIQGAAARTGQNQGGAIAATESVEEANARSQMQNQAQANQNRISSEAGYNETALSAAAKPEEMEAQLSQQQGQLGQGELNTAEDAAKTPSFMDELGTGLITAGTDFASAGAKKAFG